MNVVGRSQEYVWDVNTLEWVKMQQPILNAGSVTVSGTVTIQDGGGSITVDGPLTNSELRASEVPVSQESHIDPNNSSTSMLGSGATFTGASTDILTHARVTVMVYSDKSSASNGVQVQFSSDNSNWIDGSTFTYTAGGSSPNAGQVFSVGQRGRYMRVVYTNGASAQATFILQTILQHGNVGADVIDLITGAADNQHALITKSLIFGRTTAGGTSYVSVKVNPSGTLATATDLTQVGGSTVALGQTTMAASIPVTIASNQTPVVITGAVVVL